MLKCAGTTLDDHPPHWKVHPTATQVGVAPPPQTSHPQTPHPALNQPLPPLPNQVTTTNLSSQTAPAPAIPPTPTTRTQDQSKKSLVDR